MMWQTFYSPTSKEEALRLLAEYGPRARIIAGGTDLMVELKRGIRSAEVLVDVSRIEGLDRVKAEADGGIRVGPTVTHNQATASPLLSTRAEALVQACRQVGSAQLRNTATVVGNLVTASPANDTITSLWALDARLILESVRGERTLSFDDFFFGVRKTALAPDEMVTGIAFPGTTGAQRSIFVKLGLRRAHAISIVNAALRLTMDGDRVVGISIALGSVAPTIIRAPEAEAALVGSNLRDDRLEEVARLAAMSAAPIDDIRADAEYRRDMVRVLVRRGLVALRDRETSNMSGIDSPRLWGSGDGHVAPLSGPLLRHGAGGTDLIECTVNGQPVAVRGATGKTLLDMLRDDLGLIGSKEGCGEGECGACTLWMDGMAVLACLVPAPRAHGTRIVTVEGLAENQMLHPVQQAFVDEGAVQCGFCTPGFIMSAASLLDEVPHPTQQQIVSGISGNLCRCTGYTKIVRAVENAAVTASERSSS